MKLLTNCNDEIAMTMKIYYFCFSLMLSLPLIADVSPIPNQVDKASQLDVAVTVYNNNYGLIKEVRQLKLPLGEVELEFQDVAAQIDPTSVAFRSLTAPAKLQILEQNYRYDLLNRSALLDSYLRK